MEAGRQYLETDILSHLDTQFPDGLPDGIPMRVLTSFLAGAMLSVLMWWLDADRPCSPEEVDAMFQRLAVGGVLGA